MHKPVSDKAKQTKLQYSIHNRRILHNRQWIYYFTVIKVHEKTVRTSACYKIHSTLKRKRNTTVGSLDHSLLLDRVCGTTYLSIYTWLWTYSSEVPPVTEDALAEDSDA